MLTHEGSSCLSRESEKFDKMYEHNDTHVGSHRHVNVTAGLSKSNRTWSVLVKVESLVSHKPCLRMGFHKGDDWTCDIFPGGSSLTVRISRTDSNKTNFSLKCEKYRRSTLAYNLLSRTNFHLQTVGIQKSHHEGILGRGSWRPVDPWGELPAAAGLTSKK